MKFRSGKYIGLTVEHVKTIAPWYVKWVSENRPEMLKEHTFKSTAVKTATHSPRYKPKGYKFPGTIVSVFETTAGEVRLVAELDHLKMLHIFNETQLELA